MRMPSSFHSTEARSKPATASTTLSAVEASIGRTGRKSSKPTARRPSSPSVMAISAVRVRSPESISARRAMSAGTPAAFATFLFDVLHLDGDDLLDTPLEERSARREAGAPQLKIPGVLTSDPEEGHRVLDEALRAGHEGVVVKDAGSLYGAGRRGKAWRKVKPVRTYDLVVLGAEWGHGRRRGWLSNLHLGARDPDTGGFVMVGKCFKGLTDELLTWQTKELLERESERRGIAVLVRPELVVEIALDGVQSSTRYPGGVALRFARVKRYRPDKDPLS
jgi:ATP-dependent DNA ligase